MPIHERDAKDIYAAAETGHVLLIDVREPREFATERLPGAFLHPLSTFDPGALPLDLTREVVLYCGSGKRSMDALQRCVEAGVPVRVHLRGGLMAWKQAGLPIVSLDPATGQIVSPHKV